MSWIQEIKIKLSINKHVKQGNKHETKAINKENKDSGTRI